MKLKLHTGTTSKKIRIFIQDSSSTTNAGLTGLVYNSSGLIWYYFREGDTTATAVTMVTATLGTFTSGGFKEVDATHLPGFYEIGVPNAALSVAGSAQMMLLGATNMMVCPIEFELDAVDYSDAQRFGLTALPATDASGNVGIKNGGIVPASFSQAIIGTVSASPAPTSTVFTVTGLSGTSDLYDYTYLEFSSGTLKGIGFPIQSYVPATGVVTLVYGNPAAVAPSGGDTFQLIGKNK